MAEIGDFRPDDEQSGDMDEYLAREQSKTDSLTALIEIDRTEYEQEHGRGSWDEPSREEWQRARSSELLGEGPSWGQRGAIPTFTDELETGEMLAILGNSSRVRILVELFKFYTFGTGRITSSELCSKLDISKSNTSRILRELSKIGLVSIGRGGGGHSLDGTTERGERFIHTMNTLEGRKRTTEIKSRIEWQRRRRDAEYFERFRERIGDEEKLRSFITGFGDNTPWIYNNLPPEYEDCIEIPEPKKSLGNLRHSQWNMAVMRRISLLHVLRKTGDWTSRKTMIEGNVFPLMEGISNGRISQVIKEMIEEKLVERKRGKKRGEMLYRITKRGILRLEYFEEAPGGLGHLRELPYRGTYLLDPDLSDSLRKLSWEEIEMIAGKEFDWDYYSDAY